MSAYLRQAYDATSIERGLHDTIVDLIKSRTYCGCCDSDTNHAQILLRILRRVPVDLWPTEAELVAAGVEGFFHGSYVLGGQPQTSAVYEAVALAIRTRTPPP